MKRKADLNIGTNSSSMRIWHIKAKIKANLKSSKEFLLYIIIITTKQTLQLIITSSLRARGIIEAFHLPQGPEQKDYVPHDVGMIVLFQG